MFVGLPRVPGALSCAALALLVACGPPPPSASAWAAVAGPGAGATVAVHADTAAAEATSPAAPATPPPARVAPALPTAPAGDLQSYRGTLGDKRVVVRMTCTGATCGGYYFTEGTSEDAGAMIHLRQVEPATFESVIGYGDRATVAGKVVFDGPPGKATWRGRFLAAGATGPSSRVALTRVVPNGHPAFVRRTLSDKSSRDEHCVVGVESVEIVGLRDPILEWRINQAWSPEAIARIHLQETAPADDEKAEFDDSIQGAHIHCRIAVQQGGCYIHASVKVVMLDDHLASVAFRSDDAAGEAHPDFVVAGATVNLATGEVLDARELLADPAHEPAWGSLVVPTDELANVISGQKVDLQYATGGVGSRSYAWSQWPWKSFYLTPAGVALTPGVDESHRSLRDFVQVVPYAKLKPTLRGDGPAAYLWGAHAAKR